MPKRLDKIFRPRSIAVVGASRDTQALGHQVLKCLVEGGYTGPLYPVNPRAKVVHSLPCFQKVADLPDGVDLAVIAVPASRVIPAAEECGRKGIKGLIVITAGFRETGQKGEELEKKLLAVTGKYNMRIMGPNCMGVVNTDPDVSMNATFSPASMKRGRLAFMSQSGAMGVAILNYAEELPLGLSMFASIGNRADISGNDLLDYWKLDPGTDAILLYMESFGNPRRFTQIARTITPKKPIIAVKAGRTASGAMAADSHTGEVRALETGTSADTAVDALFEQCGVIRVETLEAMFDLARAVVNQPLPKGSRVAILTNGGGPGIMAADALEGSDLEVPPLDPRTIDELIEVLPPEASVKNPVDMTADMRGEAYAEAAPLLLKDPNIDVLLVIYIGFEYSKVADAIVEAAAGTDKPVLACMLGGSHEDPGLRTLESAGIPVYRFPESACRVIRRMVDYRRYRERDRGRVKRYRNVGREKVEEIFASARKYGRVDLSLPELRGVAEAYGAKIPKEGYAKSEDQAAEIAEDIGYPVVVKIMSDRIMKKSDVGGVVLDVRNEIELRRAYRMIMEKVGALRKQSTDGIVVQEMLKGGHELIVGAYHDPIFGPVLKIGAGGPYAELFGDFQFRIVPITPLDAMEMISTLSIYPLLEGTRGRKPVHIPSLVDLLCRASQLVDEFEEIMEFEINPLIVYSRKKDFWAVDGKLRLFPEGQHPRKK